MEISGFISSNYDGWAMIGNTAFADYMYEFAENNGIAFEHDEGLGGKKAIIKNCSMVMYISNEKIEFEEAQERFLNSMFGANGIYEMESSYTGYSEYTITGYDLERCILGGHDINWILLSHIGKYVNIRVECPKEECDGSKK